MDGQINLLTLLSLIVAVFVIFKLRSVLGRRTPDDEARIDRNMRARQAAGASGGVAGQGGDPAAARRRGNGGSGRRRCGRWPMSRRGSRSSPPAMPRSSKAWWQIIRADPSFDPNRFLKGARQAYEMIVTAFAEGNRKTLKDLLSKEVFDGFADAISDRESRGEQIDQSFVGINKADIVEAELKDGIAQVTVKFVSELISATRDRAGEVIAGDPQADQGSDGHLDVRARGRLAQSELAADRDAAAKLTGGARAG